jgi:HKD family nuclease
LPLIDQPNKGRLGDQLIELLENNSKTRFDSFYFLSAYVKSSGVERLREAVEKFRSNGGKNVWAGVGVGQRNTSIQGLRGLLTLCDEVCVYHNERTIRTFHPKVYVFEKFKEKAVVFVGSGNLTGGGLFTNYEAIFRSRYDLTDDLQRERFYEVKRMVEFYTTPSEFCKKLTTELIEEMGEEYLSDEAKQTPAEREEGDEGEGKAPKKRVFGSKGIGIPPLPKSAKVGTPQPAQPAGAASGQSIPITEWFGPSVEEGKEKTPGCDWAAKGKIRWSKTLTDRDCQVVARGTNPTGGLSLTQAKWKENGKLIDPITYFRFGVFGGFVWGLDNTRRGRTAEITSVRFCVRVSGVDRGTYPLTLRYNPKWESDERNYTTGMSWGDLSGLVTGSVMVGKKLSIYDPPAGQKEPFFLEIR